MSLDAFVCTDVGNKRRINEDNFCANLDLGLVVITDGMGGHAAGEVASRLAVEEIERVLSEAQDDDGWTLPDGFDKDASMVANKLRYAIGVANERIRHATRDAAERRGMGTTIVAAIAHGNTCTVGHVGDSRAYLYRDEHLQPLTSDHSWVNEQLKQGFITVENARNHPFRNVITQALGSGAEIRVDAVDLELRHDDLLLLCSDGLNTMLSDVQICEMIRAGFHLPLDTLSLNLIEAAKQRGGDDNITVAMMRFCDQHY